MIHGAQYRRDIAVGGASIVLALWPTVVSAADGGVVFTHHPIHRFICIYAWMLS